jgi:hypothetical protein
MEDPTHPSPDAPRQESGSNPLAPRKLRPPGSEEDGTDAMDATGHDESHGSPAISEDGHVHGLDGHDYGPSHEVHPETGERVFIVGEGEAVHVQEKPPATKEKLSAVLMAVVIHVVIAVLLTVVYLASPPPPPPQISVSAIANSSEASIESQTMKKVTQRTASTTSSSAPIVSSTAFSNFSVPTMTDASSNLTMVAMSDGDAGFGMSMSGFGDVSNMAAIPAGMQSRCSMSQRMKRLRESGGEDRCERAVREGLEFLSKKQNKEDGSFGEEFHAAMTGLALLAYLGHCETPESPKFGDSVVNAALFLMDRALKNDGKITNGKGGHHEAYEHAIATYALCELYSMTKESGKEIPRLESVLRKSVGVIVDGQTKMGGWPYGFAGGEGKEDMSVSGWQIQALKAAYNTGRNFSGVERALDLATEKYLPAIQDSDGAFKYRPEDAKGKSSLTGAALLGMQIWKGKGTPAYNKGIAYLANAYKNPTPGSNFYAPYYNTQAFFMHEGKEWEAFNKQFQPKLLDAQNDDGSWLRPGVGGHGNADAQFLNTAWAILMLEVYYRYLPTTDKVSGLKQR